MILYVSQASVFLLRMVLNRLQSVLDLKGLSASSWHVLAHQHSSVVLCEQILLACSRHGYSLGHSQKHCFDWLA